jgi:hypothetical protein
MFRRSLGAAAVFLALILGATTVLPAAAETDEARGRHKLLVVVKNPSTAKKLALLVILTQNGGAPAGAVATPGRPLTVFLANRGLYVVKAEIDSSCKGSCVASYRISGSTNHELEVFPSCQSKGSGFVCSKIKIVKVY